MATLRGQWKMHDFGLKLAALGTRYNGAWVAVERNATGFAVLGTLENACKYRRLWAALDGRPGWVTNVATRAPMLDKLDASYRREEFKTTDAVILREMRDFVTNEKGKPEARPGCHDDAVMATAIGWEVLTRPLSTRSMYDPYDGNEE
jgi:hypothetical protein